jgi:hypothetical protein
MSTTVIDYAEQQLASTGWAAIHLDIAMRLRPSLWGNIGANALHSFGNKQSRADRLLIRFPGARLFQATVDGYGAVKVLARHEQFLAERMSWVLGADVSDVMEISSPDHRPHIVSKSANSTSDPLALQHANIATKEPPRNCKQCGRMSSSQTCLAALAGDLPNAPRDYLPDLSWLRRCVAYRPPYDAYDPRTGPELWPEVMVIDDASALGKACRLITSMLNDGKHSAAEILEAAEGASIAERTMQRAADSLGIVKSKDSFSGGWTWAMPIAEAA